MPVRKKGKLPGECVTAIYEKEYGSVRPLPNLWFRHRQIHVFGLGFLRHAGGRDRSGRQSHYYRRFNCHRCVRPPRIIIPRAILTRSSEGGSAKAAGALVKQLGGQILEYVFIIELAFLKGRGQLDAPVYSMIEIDE